MCFLVCMFFFFSSRRRHTRCALVTGVQTCALPISLASRALARYDNPWPSDDVRYTPTFDEAQKDIADLTRQQLIDFHSRFYGAGTIEFAAVGAFDADAVQAALTKGLKDWRKEIGRAHV